MRSKYGSSNLRMKNLILLDLLAGKEPQGHYVKNMVCSIVYRRYVREAKRQSELGRKVAVLWQKIIVIGHRKTYQRRNEIGFGWIP